MIKGLMLKIYDLFTIMCILFSSVSCQQVCTSYTDCYYEGCDGYVSLGCNCKNSIQHDTGYITTWPSHQIVVGDSCNTCWKNVMYQYYIYSTLYTAYANYLCPLKPGPTSCPAGQYTPLNICELCKAGFFCSGTPPTHIESCPIGTYSYTNQSTCTKCSVGYYTLKNESTTCLPCPPGSFCVNGTISECTYGTYSNSTLQSSCSDCPSGYITNNKNSTSITSCILCPFDYHSPYPGSGCLPCEGSYTTSQGMTSCVTCEAGFYVE